MIDIGYIKHANANLCWVLANQARLERFTEQSVPRLLGIKFKHKWMISVSCGYKMSSEEVKENVYRDAGGSYMLNQIMQPFLLTGGKSSGAVGNICKTSAAC